MRTTIGLGALRGVLSFIATLWVIGAVWTNALAEPSSTSHLRVVRVAMQIRNLAGVDEVRENWQVTGTLISSWQDYSLAYPPRGPDDDHRDIGNSVWRPRLGLRNEISPTAFKDVDAYVQPNGTVVDWRDFSAMLSTDLDLRRFPFDSQDLPIIVGPTGIDANRMVVAFDPKLTTMPQAQAHYAELAQWKAVALTSHPYEETIGLVSTHGVRFDFRVQRNSTSYVWKFIIPLILLVMVSWVSFWLSPREFTTKDQLGTAVSTLLIVVAFSFASSNLLPRTNYITYVDALLFVSFLFVIISIGFIVTIHLLGARNSEASALRLRSIAGVIVPVSFLIAQVILIRAFGL